MTPIHEVRRSARGAARWAAIAAAVVLAAELIGLAGLPTPVLFAGFVVGIVYALLFPSALETPRWSLVAAQAVLGIVAGTYLQRSTLATVASDWFAVLLVCLVTLGLSVGCGIWLSKIAPIDLATSSFGMIAGGAAGIISISRELGADERLVAFLQYLRVLIIVALTPLVAATVFHLGSSSSATGAGGSAAEAVAFLAICTGIGLPSARYARLPAGALLGPMIVAAVFALSGSPLAVRMPNAIVDFAFAVVGLGVGLRFTVASVRQARDVLVVAALMVLAMIAVGALMGVLLASLANVSEVDGYLASTPGGLSAVIALSVGSHANATFIISVQLIRTFVMLLAAPALARWISSRTGREVARASP